jgi:cyclic pyranopterin monophosphate synthase
MGMIDISEKEAVQRSATASGKICLKKETLAAIKKNEIKKGDPLAAAEIAAILAVKRTPELIPHCHNIPIEKVGISFEQNIDHILARCTVFATAKTGVEMEALVGVTIALDTIWDMVKYLEKDEYGQYRRTRITDIMVEDKVKGHGKS